MKRFHGRWIVGVLLAVVLASLPLAGWTAREERGTQTEGTTGADGSSDDGPGTRATRDCNLLLRFASEEEFRTHLAEPPSYYWPNVWRGGGIVFSGDSSIRAAGGSSGHSSTNTQVEGVDEADLVETDGAYVYVVTPDGVVVLRAYPRDQARIVTRISTEVRPFGLYLSGDRLVVLMSWYAIRYDYDDRFGYYYHGNYEVQTRALVYDVSQPAAPLLVRELSANGYYAASRLIEDRLVLVTEHYLYRFGREPVLPTLLVGGVRWQAGASDVGYFQGTDPSANVALITNFPIRTSDLPVAEALLLPPTYALYASWNHLYLAGYRWFRTPDGFYQEETTIHKVAIDHGAVRYLCSSAVPGHVLNQFALDEHGGYLRVGTTSWSWPSENNLYILDADLRLAGSLEGLAPGEQIRGVRFLGDRAYVVTFRQIDPLFVIDLADPASPRVLGDLHIPGFSAYLHPYDANHIIGVGQAPCGGGETGWPSCIKLSLFDVTDVAHPQERGKYLIGSQGSSSIAMDDHHAFLFIPSRDLVVIPVALTEGNTSRQGAAVLAVSPTLGVDLRGIVSHQDEALCGEAPNVYWYGFAPCAVYRSLYIEDVLYSISEVFLKMTDLDGLADLGTIRLGGDPSESRLVVQVRDRSGGLLAGVAIHVERSTASGSEVVLRGVTDAGGAWTATMPVGPYTVHLANGGGSTAAVVLVEGTTAAASLTRH